MKINWKIRIQSRKFWVAMFALIGFILGEFGVWEAGKFEMLVDLLLFALIAGGVIVDPTTEGIGDSSRALDYEELGGDE